MNILLLMSRQLFARLISSLLAMSLARQAPIREATSGEEAIQRRRSKRVPDLVCWIIGDRHQRY